jgi:hypothetical protein
MSNREEPWLRVVAEPGLEPLGRNRSMGMSTTMRSIFARLAQSW